MTQETSATLYADQRRFLANLENTDKRITFHLGRLEPRTANNPAAKELRQYLAELKIKIVRIPEHREHRFRDREQRFRRS